MRIPLSTYRVQFNKDFRFPDAARIVPDLHRLGITHLYASPIFAARPNSTHGYDVVDPNRLNPELGTEADFEELVSTLKERDMGLVLDIVPNHMAASPDNVWWMDVLENGPASRFGSYFGIEWGASDDLNEKVFLPILGDPYGVVLQKGELRLSYEETGFFLNYWDKKLPVAPVTYLNVLQPGSGEMENVPELQSVLATLERLPARTVSDWELLRTRDHEKERVKSELWRLYSTNERVRHRVDSALVRLNGTPGQAVSMLELHEVLENQAYRLAFWKTAMERVNYRRFFDITDLIGMRVERSDVFDATHELIVRLVREGKADGLRVDHIDGLSDPAGYLRRLPADTYVVVEKILAAGERLPEDWPIQGTSGYDFLGYANSLFIEPQGLERLTEFYSGLTKPDVTFEDLEYERKLLASDTLFSGEMQDLGSHLADMASEDWIARDLSTREVAQALLKITASLQVYRTYANGLEMSPRDTEHVQNACKEAQRRCPGIHSAAYEYVCRVLTLQFDKWLPDNSRHKWVRFVKRWQQLTGPIMAKGVEDSVMYVYNRLVSMNEVGGIQHPVSPEEAHEFNLYRLQHWPAAMSGTSTHDTKRSEDVRARINVLSELPGEWIRLVSRWMRWMRDRRGAVDSNEEYFLYQNLIGAWPLNEQEEPSFRERFRDYLTKAAREARTHSSWLKPDERHEAELHAYADALFEDARFLQSFRPFFERVSFFGAMNSLSQVLLKATAPGVPDFYRGTISWDFSLVDPDNRRPVDFAPLTDFSERARALLDRWSDGAVKVFLTEKLLAYRNANPELFLRGNYIPLVATGKRAGNVFAFVRQHGDSWVVAVVPRFPSQLSVVTRPPLGQHAWRDTMLILPDGAPWRWKNILTGDRVKLDSSELPMHRALEHFPVALLSGR